MPYSAEAKRESIAWLKAIRAATVCVRCGKQPIDWHGEHHAGQKNIRPPAMAGRGKPIPSIAAEIARCTPLCRRCHMQADGRTRLDDTARLAIRASTQTPEILAAEYGVSPRTIQDVRQKGDLYSTSRKKRSEP